MSVEPETNYKIKLKKKLEFKQKTLALKCLYFCVGMETRIGTEKGFTEK